MQKSVSPTSTCFIYDWDKRELSEVELNLESFQGQTFKWSYIGKSFICNSNRALLLALPKYTYNILGAGQEQ